jgi:hypothetical protein
MFTDVAFAGTEETTVGLRKMLLCFIHGGFAIRVQAEVLTFKGKVAAVNSMHVVMAIVAGCFAYIIPFHNSKGLHVAGLEYSNDCLLKKGT